MIIYLDYTYVKDRKYFIRNIPCTYLNPENLFLMGKEKMKMKIVCIFVCLMLMTVFLTAAENVKNTPVSYESETVDIIFFDECEVPDWKVGNKWTYDIDNIIVDFEQPDLSVHLDGTTDDLTLEVTDDSDDSYSLSVEANLEGSFKFYTYLNIYGDITIQGPLNITGKLIDTTIEGAITFNKTDLGIKQVHVKLSGRVRLNVVEQPFINRSLSFLNIPIPADIILDIDLSNPFSIIKFPLNTTSNWGIPATNFSLSGTIQSPWLRVAYYINKLFRIPGVIPILAGLLQKDPDKLKEASDMLDDILPVIDIEHFLSKYLNISAFNIPDVPPIICCFGKDNVTVPAGPQPFEAYNISLFGTDLGNIYYSPEAGNIIKIMGNFQDIIPSVSNINAELIEYVYTP